MNCGDVKQLLSAYLDDELSMEQKKQVREHLDTCADCRREAEQLAEISRLLSQVPQVPLPAGFACRLHEALKEEGEAIRQEKETMIVPLSSERNKKKKRRTVFVGLAAAFMVGFVSLAMYNDIIPLMQRDLGADKSQAQDKLSEDRISEDADRGGDSFLPSEGAVEYSQADEGSGETSKEKSVSSSGAKENSAFPQKESGEPAELDDSQENSTADDTAGLPVTALYSAPLADLSDSAAAGGGTEGRSAATGPGAEAWRSAHPESYIPSRNGKTKSVKEVQDALEKKMDSLVSAINDRDLTTMKSLIKCGGKTDHIEDRAKIALNYYGIFFGGESVSAKQISGSDSNSHATYSLSNASGVSLDVSLTAEIRRITLNEGIIAYSYEVDQALAGTNYTLLSYTARNAAGQVEFKVRIEAEHEEIPAGQIVTFLCENGKVTRQEEPLQ